MKTINDLKLEYREKCAILEASKILKENFLVEEVVLFGSKVRGDDDKESDIDLLVLTSQPVSWKERKAINHALLGKRGSNNPLMADKCHSLGFLRIGRT